jgi:hypothetical protein
MTTSYTSYKTKVLTAKAFRDSFKESALKSIGYMYIGKTTEFPDNDTPVDMVDLPPDERNNWQNMVGAKRVSPKDIEFVIPRVLWQPNTRYKQYDDTLPLEDLTSISIIDGETVYPMYAMTSEGNVYKCLCNNVSTLSQVEPTGNYVENSGFIQTEFSDENGYLWKYMYNIKFSNKFLTPDWMPVPYIQPSTNYTDYNYNTQNLLDGTLNKIVVENGGSDYYHPTVNVAPFVAGVKELDITDEIDISTSLFIAVNMAVSGNGIFANDTHITSISSAQPKKLFLSRPTIGSGGGSVLGNIITLSTRVVVEGDGTQTITSVRLNNQNQINKIDVINAGINYTRANVTIYGSGTGAEARAVLPPKYGHGHNPAMELGATNIMIISRVGEIDSTENGKIPDDIFFRQYGILINPHKYGEIDRVTELTAPNSVSLTLNLELLGTSNFVVGEMVYQGNINDPTFVGYVVSQEINVVRLNNVYKTPDKNALLRGLDSGRQYRILEVINPDLQPFSGHILYARNFNKIQRSQAQAEEVKLVFQF